MSKRIVLFNHKGGVSKTTSVYNLGWMLSKNNRVLVVDADPQCNLSSLMLGDNFEKYYLSDVTKEQNIKDGVKVAFENGVKSTVDPCSCSKLIRVKSRLDPSAALIYFLTFKLFCALRVITKR